MKRSWCTSTVLAITLAATAASINAQEPRDQTGRPAATAPRPNPTGTEPGSMDSRTFVDQMSVAGMAEVQLGKMATLQASSADVKEFGRMMVTDHSQANQELARIAAQLNIRPATQLDQKHRDLANRLAKLRGAEFDREYMMAMVEGHEEVLNHLRMRAGNRVTANEPFGHDTAGAGTTSGSSGTQTSGNRSGSGTSSGATGTQASGSPATGGSQAVGTSGSAGDQALTAWAAKTMPTVQHHLDRARELQQQSR
jgi:putative membrane protein